MGQLRAHPVRAARVGRDLDGQCCHERVESARRRTGLVPILRHGSRLGTEELGLLAKAERASRAVGYTSTLRAGEVTLGDTAHGTASVPRCRWRSGGQWMRTAVAVPQCVLPAVNHAVVPAERALPHDVSRRGVEFRDDVAAAATTAGTAPARHIRVLVALRQVIRDPCHDGTEEDRQTENAFRDHLGQRPRVLIDVVPHIHDPAAGLTMCSIRDPATALA